MPSKFVILGIQRTGTTWIRTTLDSHPSILALGEVFLYSHGRFPFRRKVGLDVAQSYRQYIEQTLHRRCLHIYRRSAIVTEYLDHMFARPEYDAVGFKLMKTHCQQFPSIVAYLLSRDVSAIHVVRKNVLKTLLSRETARQRKLFHADKRLPTEKIRLDVKKLLPSLHKIDDDNREWEHVFRSSSYLKVSYESFVSNRADELRRIFEFLRVDPDIDASSNLVKINPDSIGDVVVNYNEVCRALEGTVFASCLDN